MCPGLSLLVRNKEEVSKMNETGNINLNIIQQYRAILYRISLLCILTSLDSEGSSGRADIESQIRIAD